jgi:hypothetical protein
MVHVVLPHTNMECSAMTVFWVCVGWLTAGAALGVLLGRAIALASDGRLAREDAHRIPDRVQGALIPNRASPDLRLVVSHPRSSASRRPLYALAALLLLGACAVPTSDEPRVTSSSGSSATVEYSGERAAEADQKADQACAQSGKRAARASTRPGATGGSMRSYECTD